MEPFCSARFRTNASRILIIAATSYIGQHIARASVALGHPTSVFLRPSAFTSKAELIQSFRADGMTLLSGSVEDRESLIAAIKEVDVIISAVSKASTLDQEKIIAAIKDVGTIKRFLPSEFGVDVDHTNPVEPVRTFYAKKAIIRRAVEAAGIPYTYISGNTFAGHSVYNLFQFGKSAPPKDKVTLVGTGNTKAIFLVEEDIGTYTIKAADDPRTLNKTVYLRPPVNILSQNEVVALWEKKIGNTLEKEYQSAEDVINIIKTSSFPKNAVYAMMDIIFLKGDQYNFEIGSRAVEASELYPEVKYTTVDEYLNRFLYKDKI